MNDIAFKTGDIVKVFQKIKEGKRERVVNFSGIVTKLRGSGNNKMVTIQQNIESIKVDRIIPLSMLGLVKIDLVSEAKKVRGNLPKKASLERFLGHKSFKS